MSTASFQDTSFFPSLTKQYLRACSKLSVHAGASLSKHAAFIKNSEYYESQRLDMEESFDLMQDVYTRLEELEVKLEIEDMARLSEVEDRKSNFETSLFDAAAHIKAEKEEYAEQLKLQVKHMEEKLEEITKELDAQLYAEPNEEPSKVCESLAHVRERALHQKEKADHFKEVDGLLSKSAKSSKGEVAALVDALALLDKRSQTWMTWAEWRETYAGWLASDCRVFLNPEHPENEGGFDGPQLEKAVEEFYQKGVQFNRLGWREDPIVKAYLADVRKTRKSAQFLAQFGHPSLLKRHWTAIFGVLGKVYDPENDTPNLGDLIEWGLLD